MQKITKEFLSSNIDEYTFIKIPDTTTTICNIILKNGFSVRGESACININDYDQQLGEQIAYDNAFEKLWLLYGFHEVENEYSGVSETYIKLSNEIMNSFTELNNLCISAPISLDEWEEFGEKVIEKCLRTNLLILDIDKTHD